MAPRLQLTHLTRDPAWIQAADAAGIERIGIDIERIGKHSRQAVVADARISDHELRDLLLVRANVRHGKPFVRLNRPYPGTAEEIEQALAFGARSLMLPGFDTAQEVADFVAFVGGRAEVILLLETRTATDRLDAILAVPGIDELMVGLNDMSMQFGLPGPMAMAFSPVLDSVAGQVRAIGIPFGFGGVARPERHDLPVDPDLLLARYAELGATRAWIARSFTNDGLAPAGFAAACDRLQRRYAHWCGCDHATRHDALTKLRARLSELRP